MDKEKYKVKNNEWDKYEEDSAELLYSYIKKKGKHKRAKSSPTNKKF